MGCIRLACLLSLIVLAACQTTGQQSTPRAMNGPRCEDFRFSEPSKLLVPVPPSANSQIEKQWMVEGVANANFEFFCNCRNQTNWGPEHIAYAEELARKMSEAGIEALQAKRVADVKSASIDIEGIRRDPADKAKTYDTIGRIQFIGQCIVSHAGNAPHPISAEVRGSLLRWRDQLKVTASQRQDASTMTVADRLRELDALLSNKLVTTEEYEEKRRSILNDL